MNRILWTGTCDGRKCRVVEIAGDDPTHPDPLPDRVVVEVCAIDSIGSEAWTRSRAPDRQIEALAQALLSYASDAAVKP